MKTSMFIQICSFALRAFLICHELRVSMVWSFTPSSTTTTNHWRSNSAKKDTRGSSSCSFLQWQLNSPSVSGYLRSKTSEASEPLVTPTLSEEMYGKTTVGRNTRTSNRALPKTSSLVGVIFDMDGTLVKPCIDFADMRRRIYEIADQEDKDNKLSRGCVLELETLLSPSGKRKAEIVFKDIEHKAIQAMELNDGTGELMRYLDSVGIRRAVLTRNVHTSVNHMHDLLFEQEGVSPFYPSVARDTTSCVLNEDGESIVTVIPAKPEPNAILHICSLWDCRPEDVIMVGDSVADDIVCAYRAACGGSVLLTGKNGKMLDNDSGNDRDANEELQERIPSISVDSLRVLYSILEES